MRVTGVPNQLADDRHRRRLILTRLRARFKTRSTSKLFSGSTTTNAFFTRQKKALGFIDIRDSKQLRYRSIRREMNQLDECS